MAKAILAFIILVGGAFMTADLVQAQSSERSGREVVNLVCANCHRTGVNGAPKIGDKQAWSKRAARGLSSLTANALAGIRKMPAHGGHPELGDTEIRRAITYMVNESGGHWIEPISKTARPQPHSGEQIVKSQCIKCHGTGVDGAPKIDDRAAWAPRMRQGLDATVRSAAHGHGAMPARGGIADLTDTELRAAILYMFYPGATAAPTAATPGPVPADPHRRVADGMEIYLGVAPAGPGSYHINISLRDAATHAQIKDAAVQARVASALGGTTKKLEAKAFNDAVSYVNDFRMEGNQPYTITARIRKPGTSRATEVKFEFKP